MSNQDTKKYSIWREIKDGSVNGKWDIAGQGLPKERCENLAQEFDTLFPYLRHEVRERNND